MLDKATPPDGTALAREYGATLRKLRNEAKLTTRGIAHKLGWSHPKVSLLESGTRAVSAVEIGAYLAYVARGVEISELAAYGQKTVADYRSQQHGDGIYEQLKSISVLDSTAEQINTFDPSLVPGQLQIEGYAHELLSLQGFDDEKAIAGLVRARLARQSKVKERLKSTFYIHEQALRPLGNSEVMQEQILYLIFVGLSRSCRIQIVPNDAYPIATLGGRFSLYRFAEYPSIVHVESRVTSLFLEDPQAINKYEEILCKLETLALSCDDSCQLLATFQE